MPEVEDFKDDIPCNDCSGTGELADKNTCSTCKGSGEVAVVLVDLEEEDILKAACIYNKQNGWKLSDDQLETLASKTYKDIDEGSMSLYCALHDMNQFLDEVSAY